MKRLFIGLIICAPQVFCMQEKYPMQKRDRDLYFQECKKSSECAERKLHREIVLAEAIGLERRIEEMERELQEIKQGAIQGRNDELRVIRIDHDISEKVWNQRIEIAQNTNQYEEEEQNEALEPYLYESNLIPLDVKIMMKKNLLNNGINPERYYIRVSRKDTFKVTPEFEITPVDFNWMLNNGRLASDRRHAGRITINDNIFSSSGAKDGVCCVVANALKKESRYYLYVLHALSDLDIWYNSTAHVNMRFKDRDRAKNEMIFLSSLIAAADSAYDAAIIKKYYDKTYNKFLSVEGYDQLCAINRLHKGISWLKKYMIGDIKGLENRDPVFYHFTPRGLELYTNIIFEDYCHNYVHMFASNTRRCFDFNYRADGSRYSSMGSVYVGNDNRNVDHCPDNDELCLDVD